MNLNIPTSFQVKPVAFVLLIILLTVSCKDKKSSEGYRHQFDFAKIAKLNSGVAKISKGEGSTGNILKISPSNENRGFTLWQKGDPGSWEKGKFLVYEVWHDNDYCVYLSQSFYGTSEKVGVITFQGEDETLRGQVVGGPKITTKVGILPGLKTQVIYPLEYLDIQTVHGQRFPRQLKTGTRGERVYPEDITKVSVSFYPYLESRFKPELEIAAIYLTDTIPEPLEDVTEYYVDEFGQWALKDWPGKTHSVENMKSFNDSLLNVTADSKFKDDWSKYGGQKSLRFKSTGFFRTHNDGKRWWFADPEGYAFLSIGVDGVRSSVGSYTTGQEDLFKFIPGSNQLVNTTSNSGLVDFYSENLKRVFGDEWREKWESITRGLLKQHNFNTVGNWSDIQFARNAQMPYVLNMDGFPSTTVLLYRDFPDVFSSEYAEQSGVFAKQLESFKNDRFLIGYFLRNEPKWAMGLESHNLAYEMFATSKNSFTKQEFIKWISEKYENNITGFNGSWGIELKTFDELKEKIFREIPNENADMDFYEFSKLMVKKYVNVPCDAIDKIDSNHLNLGMRYGSLSSELLYNASDRFDVFSINSYGYEPASTSEIEKISGKPVMIGEFHFGALDRGLPATGLGATVSQEDRGKAYQHYLETGFSRPELIAIHWFIWIDEPVTGRHDGENYNIGMVDVCNRPYRELMNAARITNGRIYDVVTGKLSPVNEQIEKIPVLR